MGFYCYEFYNLGEESTAHWVRFVNFLSALKSYSTDEKLSIIDNSLHREERGEVSFNFYSQKFIFSWDFPRLAPAVVPREAVYKFDVNLASAWKLV